MANMEEKAQKNAYAELITEMPQEELWNRCLLAYRRRDFNFLDASWRFLPSDKRLEIIYRSHKDGIDHFTQKDHFELHKNDLKVIEDAMGVYYKEFNVSEELAQQLFRSFRTKDYRIMDDGTRRMVDDREKYILKILGLYARLREYDELTKKFPCFSREIIGQNPNIMKCDTRRTSSRIAFLLEINNGKIPDENAFARDLTAMNDSFNLKYQKEITKKLYFLERGTVAYSVLANMVNEVPDYAYDKFIELSLRALYGEERLLYCIEKEKRKRTGILAENAEYPRELEENIATDNMTPDSSESIEVRELFDGAFPENEGMRTPYGKDVEKRSKSKPNNNQKLDEQQINAFLKELQRIGIQCEGYITSKSGLKAINEDNVRYYVLRKGNYIVLEPIGQVGNSTLVLRDSGKIEELRKLLNENKKEELVMKGLASRVNHKRTKNQEYHYSIFGIQNIMTIIQEFSKEKSKKLTLADLRRQIIEFIPPKEILEASKYILNVGGLINLARYIDEKEQKMTGRPSTIVKGRRSKQEEPKI